MVGGHGSSDRDPTAMGVGTMVLDTYPVLGLLNPLALLAAMETFSAPQIRTLAVGTALPWYYRADEPLDTVARLIEVVEDAIAVPAQGLMPRLRRLRELAARWGGEQNADRLCEAFYLLDEAVRLKTLMGRYSTLYAGVSTRHVTRPLLLRPDVLSSDEEGYFLPFIFNVSETEARHDYSDVHGGRMHALLDEPVHRSFLSTTARAAGILEEMPQAPRQAWLAQMACSLRMWASVMESVHNFSVAQRIRDARRTDLSAPPPAHFKDSGTGGSPDYFLWYEIQRRELDNTAELIRLLKSGGLAVFAHARRAQDEDTFLLGPDLLENLETKRRLMRSGL